MSPGTRTAVLFACGLTVLAVDACSNYSSSPTTPVASPSPTLTTAATPPPVATPTPAPSPTPTPAPTPDPTPTPSTAPSPAPTPTPTPVPSVVVIEIVANNGNMSFSPATSTLQVGQQVRWHNAHTETHTATQDGGGFDTGLIRPGATSAPITLTTPGTLRYHCEIHPVMVGSLNVTP